MSGENMDELIARTSGELIRFAREKQRAQRRGWRPALAMGLLTIIVVAGLLLYWIGPWRP